MSIENDAFGMTNQDVIRELGEQIRRARLSRNISQADLSTHANISRRAVQSLENGDGSSLETLVAVCRCLGKVPWLLAFEPTPTVNPMLVIKMKEKAAAQVRQRASSAKTRGGL